MFEFEVQVSLAICTEYLPAMEAKYVSLTAPLTGNAAHPMVHSSHAVKLDRLYLLNKFHDLKLGYRLLQFNIAYSQKFNQDSMWLFVWKGNERAVKFYLKAGFEIKGSHDFKLTENHSNPNHLMVMGYL